MPSGIYDRSEINKSTYFKKGCIPHNKNVQSRKVLKKIEAINLGIPIKCVHHGEHLKWRMHSDNNVQCKLCITEWQRRRRNKYPLKFLIIDAKHHARKCKRKFEITIEQIENILIKQHNKCALSGIIFTDDNKPSLDRIDSELGYIIGNVQLVDKRINKMKSNLSEKDFIFLCNCVSNQIKENLR